VHQVFIELFNTKRHYTSTFLHKGYVPIPQLFGARNLFVTVLPVIKKIRRYATSHPDLQGKRAEMNPQLNFWYKR
jgi:hypothetical protein